MVRRSRTAGSAAAMRTTPHRRAVLVGMGAAVSLLWSRPAAARIAYAIKIGNLEVEMFSDGVLNVPLSFTLPETPAAEIAALFKAHGLPEGGMPAQTNVALVKSGKDMILIDAGSGPNFQPTAGKLESELLVADIDPKLITKVVFTHGHADHLWGVIDDFGDGERFPNATYVISAAEWDFWTSPDIATRVPDVFRGMGLGTARILKKIEHKVERRKAGDTVAPGLTYMATPGHTPGHMSVLIEDGGQRLMVGGDVLIHTATSFARPDWRAGNDFDRDQGVATRKRLLDQLSREKIPLAGFHLAWPGLGHVERAGTAYRFIPL